MALENEIVANIPSMLISKVNNNHKTLKSRDINGCKK